MTTFSISFRSIFYLLGLLACVGGASMAILSLVEFLNNEPDWPAFATSAAITLFAGGSLALSTRPDAISMSIRDGALLTVMAWSLLSVIGALPFMLGAPQLSFTDAVFEAMSGLTTTGSTVIVGLDNQPSGILLWRSLLNWFGGIGIIVIAIALLPSLRVGGMQLFRLESSDKSEKVLPRASQISSGILKCYVGLSVLCALCYWLAGMPAFDAVNNAMSTLATGGFAPSDSSFGKYESTPLVHWVGSVFMLLGSLPFVLYLRALNGHALPLVRNGQVQAFFAIVGACIAMTAIWLIITKDYGIEPAFRHATFNLVSIVSTTGYASEDYWLWGALPHVIVFGLTFMGGCTGSTSGGLKVFRIQVLFKLVALQLKRFVHPNAIYTVRHEGKPLTDDIGVSVLVFQSLYGASILAVALGCALFGVDFLTALSGAAQALGNVGPGLGPIIGPAGNFSSLPDGAIWCLTVGMLLGRLELYTLVVVFTPAFWRA